MHYTHKSPFTYYNDNSDAVTIQLPTFRNPLDAYNYFTRHRDEFEDALGVDLDGEALAEQNVDILDLLEEPSEPELEFPSEASNESTDVNVAKENPTDAPASDARG